MLKFSKKVEYAVISLLYMANQAAGKLTTARELSENFNIPPEVAGKVLQKLARKKLVLSVQGVKGGYQFDKQPDVVDLYTVISAIDGPIKLVSCVNQENQCGCDQLDFCNMRDPMQIVQARLVHFFRSFSLRDLQNGTTAALQHFAQSGLSRPAVETENV